MNRLKAALAGLDHSVERLEQTLATRFSAMESALRATRADYESAAAKAKNTQKVSERLDQVIAQLETILASDK
jgi:hypothetical protein